jgi:hypothetical protein
MDEIKSRQGRWSVSLCNCSQDTAHVQYSNIVIHVLRELGLAMQYLAQESEPTETSEFKKGLVQ